MHRQGTPHLSFARKKTVEKNIIELLPPRPPGIKVGLAEYCSAKTNLLRGLVMAANLAKCGRYPSSAQVGWMWFMLRHQRARTTSHGDGYRVSFPRFVRVSFSLWTALHLLPFPGNKGWTTLSHFVEFLHFIESVVPAALVYSASHLLFLFSSRYKFHQTFCYTFVWFLHYVKLYCLLLIISGSTNKTSNGFSCNFFLPSLLHHFIRWFICF